MMLLKNKFFLFVTGLVFGTLLFSFTAFGFSISGYTYDLNGTALNATNVSIEAIFFGGETGRAVTAVNSTLSNASGFYNLSIADNASVFYHVETHHFNGSGRLDYIGQFTPDLPLEVFNTLTTINFFMKPGATLNFTAFSSFPLDSTVLPFDYELMDQRTGYIVDSCFSNNEDGVSNCSTQLISYVQADRNYSIEFFPNSSMSVGYNINNISAYGAAPLINLPLNLSARLLRVSGFVSVDGFANITVANLTDLDVVSYLLIAEDIVPGEYPMPYNMSRFMDGTDLYNTTSGFFNVSLPAAVLGADMLLFITARNGTGSYFGSFENITLLFSDSDVTNFNTTLRPLLGNVTNITVENSAGDENITTLFKSFHLENDGGNDTGDAFIELDFDYSNFDMFTFTWTVDVEADDGGNFSVPLLSDPIPEINIYSSDAPFSTSLTAAQLSSDTIEIEIPVFNPGAIEDSDRAALDLFVDFIKSNSTCNVPYPGDSCSLMPRADFDAFDPIGLIIGGGSLSFRMVDIETGIIVHYNDVDLIASGPPDALFDTDSDDTSNSNNNLLEAAWRFGSTGPEIYDSVLIGIPYDDTSFVESEGFTIRLENLYDNDWNVIWNIDDNETDEVPENYEDFLVAPYAGYLNTSVDAIDCSSTNVSAVCYVNTTDDMIWLTIPHFSGIGPVVTGTETSSGGDGGSGGGSNTPRNVVTSTFSTDGVLTVPDNPNVNNLINNIELQLTGCNSFSCSVTASEIDQSVVSDYVLEPMDAGGSVVGILRLECSGGVGFIRSSADVDSCDRLSAYVVHDDRTTIENVPISCSANRLTATVNGCSLLVVWREALVEEPLSEETVEQDSLQPAVQPQVQETPAEVEERTINSFVIVIVIVVVVLLFGYLFYGRRSRHH